MQPDPSASAASHTTAAQQPRLPDTRNASPDPQQSKHGLEAQKLQLEIAHLRRSPWWHPAVIVPLIASLAVLGLSQYLGVFDVERKRADIERRDAEYKLEQVNQEIAKLEKARTDLQRQRAELEGERKRLFETIKNQQSQVDRLTARELAALRQAKEKTDESQRLYVLVRDFATADYVASAIQSCPPERFPGTLAFQKELKKVAIDFEKEYRRILEFNIIDCLRTTYEKSGLSRYLRPADAQYFLSQMNTIGMRLEALRKAALKTPSTLALPGAELIAPGTLPSLLAWSRYMRDVSQGISELRSIEWKSASGHDRLGK